MRENNIVPTLNIALSPLAFPIIVTPYGIAAIIVFLALSPDLSSKLIRWCNRSGNYGIESDINAHNQAYI